MTKWPQESWLTKSIVVMVMLIFASHLPVGCGTASPEPPTSTPASFSYSVRVEEKDTGKPIPKAEVRIEVGGKAPLDEIADAGGYARIIIDSSYVGQPGKLIVKATGYEECEKIIDLTEGTLSEVIPLQKESVVVLPSPTLTLTATPEPMPTNTPKLTPTPAFMKAQRDLNLRAAPSLRIRVKDVLPKGSLFKIVGSYYKDKPREWLLVEAENELRGWTLLDEDTFPETPTSTVEKFTPTVIPTVPLIQVPATPTALPPPTLISPKTISDIVFIGDVVLEWDWDSRTLEEGWFYSVRVGQDAGTGHPEEPLPCFHDKFSFANEYQGDLGACVPGRYYWEVAVAARNEEFVQESTSTEYIPEEVEEWTEISVVSAREYFYYTDQEPTPTSIPPTPTDTPAPLPTDTPAPLPTDTPGPDPNDTPGPGPEPKTTPCQPGRPGCG